MKTKISQILTAFILMTVLFALLANRVVAAVSTTSFNETSLSTEILDPDIPVTGETNFFVFMGIVILVLTACLIYGMSQKRVSQKEK